VRCVCCVQRSDIQMDGQRDDIPIMCLFHVLYYKIAYEFCVTALFLFHVTHKRDEFENALCVCMGAHARVGWQGLVIL
jgi:hypothetical protein